jgi:hypothetical protein
LPPIFLALIHFWCSSSVLSVLQPLLGFFLFVFTLVFGLIFLWRPKHRVPAAQELCLGPACPGAARFPILLAFSCFARVIFLRRSTSPVRVFLSGSSGSWSQVRWSLDSSAGVLVPSPTDQGLFIQNLAFGLPPPNFLLHQTGVFPAVRLLFFLLQVSPAIVM